MEQLIQKKEKIIIFQKNNIYLKQEQQDIQLKLINYLI